MKKQFFIVSLLIHGLAYSQVPTDGLVARYDFSNTSNFYSDGTSNGYNLCGIGDPTIDQGVSAGDSAAFFDSNDYAYYCGGNGTGFLSSSVTISAWVKLSQYNAYNTIAVMRYNVSSSPYNSINLFTGNASTYKLSCAVTNGVELDHITYGTTAMQLGQWYHTVCTYDAITGDLHVYLNGTLEGSTTLTPSAIIYDNDNFTIGHIPTGAGANAFIGHIDEVLYYDRAITAEEVCEIYTHANCNLSTPSAPSDLAAAPNGSNQVDLTWNDNATDETGFSLERSTDGVNFTSLATIAANTENYNDASVTTGTSYYYRIAATNANGNSGYSNIAQITTGSLGIEVLTEADFKVSPNPSSGTFHIDLPTGWNDAQVTLTGTDGAVVYVSTVSQFSTPQLTQGVYLLTFVHNGSTVVKRVVIR